MTGWALGEKFGQKYPHLGSIEKLWNQKWKFPCSKSVYPFHDGKLEDFEPVFEELINKSINDGYSDEYTQVFLPRAEALVKKAASVEASDKLAAIDLYKRAAVVYRIARFPYICSPVKRQAYEAQKHAYLKSASLWDVPITDISIPHTAAANGDDTQIPLYLRIPPGASKESPVPVLLLMTGLDGHRPDNTMRTDEFLNRGWASVIADIPGTADCPANRRDPKSPDRLWTAVLDWIFAQPHLNRHKVCAWGLSAGGYYAIRAAHTHADRLVGACGQGAATHHTFSRGWLDHVDDHEYPFVLTPAFAEKHGYKDVEEMKANAQKDFSLVENGIVDMRSTRLLLVNGVQDGLMPIEDSMLLMEHGRPKEARFYTGLPHMGYPPANESVWPWLEEVMATSSTSTGEDTLLTKVLRPLRLS